MYKNVSTGGGGRCQLLSSLFLSPSLAYKLCSSPSLPAGRRDDSSAANQLGWVLVYAALDLLDKK